MFTISHLIAPRTPFDGAPTLTGRLTLDGGHGEPVRATLRYSALGIVDAVMNGSRVSEDLLTPGWSSYEWRVRVAESDVTSLVEALAEHALVLRAAGDPPPAARRKKALKKPAARRR